MTNSYFIGTLSGTSLDGLDLALVSIDHQGTIQQHDALSWDIPQSLQERLRALCTPGNEELVHFGSADRRFAEVVAAGVHALLTRNQLGPEAIRAIGSHGQTVRHHPEQPPGFSIQLGCPHTIAALTGIDVVAQFRQKDIALGGEGAPLAPLFHREVFTHPSHDRIIANIGGIANISYLPHGGSAPLLGFDTGPGNTLMDDWIQRHHQQAYDIGGRWAATGKVHEGLLDTLMSDPYFKRTPPKSTGREYFTSGWLHHRLERFEQIPPEDVQATLLECTAKSLCDAIQGLLSAPERTATPTELFFCGGGAHNTELLARCATMLPECRIASTDELGIQVDWVEAVLFAWLAWCHCERKALDLTSVTGASRPAILGGYFPAQ
ncbi:anhydro-N-acetylmuramic acid kinase [Aliidiomarina halalkaliphila]|uniref:Anhydro-N-acetylmuramic acid kinase n=1 Tax=Aliidiomarina halalkaliphila TaxID=2593535 RepID=A0A552WZC8_9GAMM|nr:anhydro-N-acetylmuramic acid kinase [Aliidiomarina halalkaliphila]TRW48157.1 anhydro-N-acetylmuramic acid kinase [Aliidiomarina halalkaliphila]